MPGDERGVSTVMGIALLLALVMVGMALVVTVGATALTETRDGLDTSRAEKAMTQFDSRSAMVALGGTSHQGVDLAATNGAGYGVDPDAGWMNVTLYNESANNHTMLVNATLGALTYENGEDSIAYQGGGVWQGTPAGERMLSPPEFHFRQQTLTLPIITVGGAASIGTSASVQRAGPTEIYFPNEQADSNFTNPLTDGHVNVTVHSRYYEAWGTYFEERTSGNVHYDHDAETVTANLIVPFDENFANAVATTAPGGITVNGNDPPPSPSETGVNYPLADDRIEENVEDCENDPTACDETTAWTSISTAGTYYVDGSYVGGVNVDTNDGNVTLVVNGDFEPSSVSLSGPNATTVLVRGDVDGSNGEHTNTPGRFRVVVHSDGEFDMNGNSEFTGFVYAPGSECDLNGNSYIVGGSVCETMDINGNPNDFVYDDSVENVALLLDQGEVKVTYLHVTVNPITIESG